MFKWISFITLCSFSLTSCCTLSRNQAHLCITSNVPDTQIILDGCPRGTTPQVVKVDPKRSHNIVLEKEGYQSRSYYLPYRTSPMRLGSNLIFPVAGAGIGAGAGALAFAGDPYASLGIIFTTVLGLCIGTAAGAVGTGVDLMSGNARTLRTDQIDGHLIKSGSYEDSFEE